MPKPAKAQPLTDEEMVTILEDLARNSGSATARIQAIKTLREIRNGEQTPAEGFERLDAAQDLPRIRRKAA